MRALFVLLIGCGRVGFDPAGDDLAGLVAHYPMDNDPSVAGIRGFPATYTASCAPCPTARDGVRGGAYAFPGDVRVVLPGTEALLTATAPFTAALWVEASAAIDKVEIPLSKPHSLTNTSDTLALTISAAGSVEYETNGLSNTPQYFPVSSPSIRGAWHHIAMSFDGTTRVLYVDGGAFEDATPSLDGMLPVAIGADLDGGVLVFGFTGGLDDLRIYDRALAPDEVSLLAQ